VNAETRTALDALTDPSVRSEIVQVIADADSEAQDHNRDDAVESLEEWVRRKHRAGDRYVIKHLRFEGVDWYAVVDALEPDYPR
jgi:hypothetical protein